MTYEYVFNSNSNHSAKVDVEVEAEICYYMWETSIWRQSKRDTDEADECRWKETHR